MYDNSDENCARKPPRLLRNCFFSFSFSFFFKSEEIFYLLKMIMLLADYVVLADVYGPRFVCS